MRNQQHTLPTEFEFLASERAPKMLLEGLQTLGVREVVGPGSNQSIISMRDYVARAETQLRWIGTWYKDDDTPWCGLWMAYVALKAGKPVGFSNPLAAKSWLKWGTRVASPELGDVCIFVRKGGGHVGLYAGENATCYFVLGGNQNNQVCITAIRKERLIGARNYYAIGKPHNVGRRFVTSAALQSENEQ